MQKLVNCHLDSIWEFPVRLLLTRGAPARAAGLTPRHIEEVVLYKYSLLADMDDPSGEVFSALEESWRYLRASCDPVRPAACGLLAGTVPGRRSVRRRWQDARDLKSATAAPDASA